MNIKIKILSILFITTISCFSQAIKNNPDYPFPTYCWSGDGVSNYIDIDNIESTIGSDNTGVIEFNASLNSGVVAISYVFSYSEDNINSFGIRFQTGKFKIIAVVDNTNNIVETSSTYNDGIIRNFKVTSNGSEWSLEVDGVSVPLIVNTGVNNGNWFADYTGNYIRIGLISIPAGDFNYHQGQVSMLNIDNKAYFPLCASSQNIAYDVSGNSNNGSMFGSDYWTKCTSQDYPETYGMTKVTYLGHIVYVPYLLSGTPIYDHSSPVMNANETYINYLTTSWGVTKLVTTVGKIIKQ